MKKSDLAKKLNLRYATLLEWEKNRPEVYKRLILSYEYEKIVDEFTCSLNEVNDRVKQLKSTGY